VTDQSQCFLEAGDDFCKLDYEKEDLSDLTIHLDRSKILTTGRKGKWFTSATVQGFSNPNETGSPL